MCMRLCGIETDGPTRGNTRARKAATRAPKTAPTFENPGRGRAGGPIDDLASARPLRVPLLKSRRRSTASSGFRAIAQRSLRRLRHWSVGSSSRQATGGAWLPGSMPLASRVRSSAAAAAGWWPQGRRRRRRRRYRPRPTSRDCPERTGRCAVRSVFSEEWHDVTWSVRALLFWALFQRLV